MKFLEKDLETIIYENVEACYERGLDELTSHVYLRQINLGSYGILDLVGISIQNKFYGYRVIEITIFELKKELIDASAMLQAFRYRVGIKRWMKSKFTFNYVIKFKLVLVGKELQYSGDFVFALDALDIVSTYTYDYGVDGIKFTCHDSDSWSLNNESFLEKDFSKQFKFVLKKRKDIDDFLKLNPDSDDMPF